MFSSARISGFFRCAYTQSHQAFDTAVRSFNLYLGSIIGHADPHFGTTITGEKLQRAWEYVKNSEVNETDKTTEAVKKLAFTLFVSLPSLFLFKEIAQAATVSFSKISDLLNIKNLAQFALLLYIVMPIISFLENYFYSQKENETMPFYEDFIDESNLHDHEDELQADPHEYEVAYALFTLARL